MESLNGDVAVPDGGGHAGNASEATVTTTARPPSAIAENAAEGARRATPTVSRTSSVRATHRVAWTRWFRHVEGWPEHVQARRHRSNREHAADGDDSPDREGVGAVVDDGADGVDVGRV